MKGKYAWLVTISLLIIASIPLNVSLAYNESKQNSETSDNLSMKICSTDFWTDFIFYTYILTDGSNKPVEGANITATFTKSFFGRAVENNIPATKLLELTSDGKGYYGLILETRYIEPGESVTITLHATTNDYTTKYSHRLFTQFQQDYEIDIKSLKYSYESELFTMTLVFSIAIVGIAIFGTIMTVKYRNARKSQKSQQTI